MIQELGYPAVEEILPQIMEWLQDSNWPVAKELNEFIISVGTPIAPYIKNILNGDDETWKYFILSSVVRNSPELAQVLYADLTRIADFPTRGEKEEEVSAVAREILEDLYGN